MRSGSVLHEMLDVVRAAEIAAARGLEKTGDHLPWIRYECVE